MASDGIMLHQEAIAELRAERLERALEHIRQAYSINPESKDIYHDYIVILQRVGRHRQAIALFKQRSGDFPSYVKTAVARAYLRLRKDSRAEELINEVLNQNPQERETLFLRGELLEYQKKFLAAYLHYMDMQEKFPGNQAAIDLAHRALMSLGATDLVRQRVELGGQLDKDLRHQLAGDISVAHVRWQEFEQALAIVEQNIDRLAGTPLAKSNGLQRALFDRIVIKRQLERMHEVLAETACLRKQEIELPPWVLAAEADAYLYLKMPEKALPGYERLLQGGWDSNAQTRVAIIHTLVDLGKYAQAETMLEQVIADLPTYRYDRGYKEKNWIKANLVIYRAWLLLYQDRLAEAQPVAEDILAKAPLNTNTRNALAHTYLWRGWPRRALAEFELLQTVDPEYVPAQIGYSYALYETGHYEQAVENAQALTAERPRNLHVQRLNRFLELQRMTTLQAGSSFVSEDDGADSREWFARLDQPLTWRSKIFFEYIYRLDELDEFEDERNWGRLGVTWKFARNWQYTGAVSLEQNDDEKGLYNRFAVALDDYWDAFLEYETNTLDVPLRARAFDVSVDRGQFGIEYRHSEIFSATLATALRDFSDGNQSSSLQLSIDRALTTAPYWKTRVAVQGFLAQYEKQDVSYYSPEQVGNIYVVPRIEHVMFRRFERSHVQRFSAGLGRQWQREFDGGTVWFGRYEQEHTINDRFSFLLGLSYSRNIYDDDTVDAIGGNFLLRILF